MNTEKAKPHRGHRITPSFTDSAISVDMTESGKSDHHNGNDGDDFVSTLPTQDTISIHQRISQIAQLASENSSARRELSVDESAAASNYLDKLESLILDPRPRISQIIALNRPSGLSLSSGSTTETSASSAATVVRRGSNRVGVSHSASSSSNKNRDANQASPDLASVLEELSSVNKELQQRYLESRHIHDLFIIKCEGLAQRIIELENEVHDLKSDILEDTIELEGLRGTVRGLESWVGRWQRQREAAAIGSSTSSKSARRKSSWRRKKQSTNNDVDAEQEENGNDFDTLLDGVLAWMRGWNDVEEGFLIRARRRKMRRG